MLPSLLFSTLHQVEGLKSRRQQAAADADSASASEDEEEEGTATFDPAVFKRTKVGERCRLFWLDPVLRGWERGAGSASSGDAGAHTYTTADPLPPPPPPPPSLSQGETPEERRARKQAIKEMKRERREAKKANKVAFKREEKRQLQVRYNAEHHEGMKLIK